MIKLRLYVNMLQVYPYSYTPCTILTEYEETREKLVIQLGKN